jgi:23S rRNA (uracil-5-)-methyltransferase RumA
MSHCPNKNVCGSCAWSHIQYEKQLEQKLGDIKLNGLDLYCDKILPSPKTEHYRNRMDFVIDFEGRVGLRQKGKWWRVIDNHPCFISDERIEELFHAVRNLVRASGLSYYDRKSHEGFLRYAVIRASSIGQSMVNIVTSEGSDGVMESWSDEVGSTTLVWSINHTDSDVSFGDDLRVLDGAGYIEEQIGNTRYRISPNAFFQTNSYAAHLLVDTVMEFVGDLSQKTLLDLYCGTGFFAVALAPFAKRTIGVEMVDDAVNDAKMNASLNNASVEFYSGKTEDFEWTPFNADVVILDPPRSGMHDRALADILHALPQTIVYVSCNHKNFAREMVQLQKFYKIDNMRAIDMFPHTPHVELVSVLRKK